MVLDHERTAADSERKGTSDPVNRYRSDFPAFAAGAGHFLDSAASSLKPQIVIDAMAEFAGTVYANVHRGAYRLSMESTERYEAARVRLGGFLGTRPDQVVFTRGTTTGLNMVASGWGGTHLREGDRILLTHMEHHANLVPWQMVAKRTGAVLDFVPISPDFTLDLDIYEELQGHIDASQDRACHCATAPGRFVWGSATAPMPSRSKRQSSASDGRFVCCDFRIF